MPTYSVRNAICDRYKPLIPYNQIYADTFSFEATNETEAVEHVRKLQKRHDDEYMDQYKSVKVRWQQRDFILAPLYELSLYDQDGNEIIPDDE